MREIGEAEAAVITLKNEAQNKLGSNVIDFELAKKRIETMPAALGEMVKPIANLKDVRILHTGGVFGGGNGSRQRQCRLRRRPRRRSCCRSMR